MIDRLRSSVQYKIAGVIFAAVLVASLANAWHGMQSTSSALTNAAESALASSVVSQGQKVESTLAMVAADLKFLVQVPPVQGLLRAIDNFGIDPSDGSTSELWGNRLTTIFSGLLRSRPDYLRVRPMGKRSCASTKRTECCMCLLPRTGPIARRPLI